MSKERLENSKGRSTNSNVEREREVGEYDASSAIKERSSTRHRLTFAVVA